MLDICRLSLHKQAPCNAIEIAESLLLTSSTAYAFHGLEYPDPEAGASLASVLLPIWHVAGRTSDRISLMTHVIVTCLFCILHKPMAARHTQYCA